MNIENLKSKSLIHYGAKKYKPELIKPITNINREKPYGGLWTSPIDSNWGWKNWCDSENFRECNIENSFTLKLYDWSKICVIDSVSDLMNLPYYENYMKFLDFEEIAKNYDAIWLTDNGQTKTKFSNPSLYGWDCESVLILNPKCCYQIPSQKQK